MELQLDEPRAKNTLAPRGLLRTLNWKATFLVPGGITELGKMNCVGRFWPAYPFKTPVWVLVPNGVAPKLSELAWSWMV